MTCMLCRLCGSRKMTNALLNFFPQGLTHKCRVMHSDPRACMYKASPAMTCKPCLVTAPRTAPGPALRTREVTRCAQHTSGSARPSQGKYRKPQQKSAKGTKPTTNASKTVTPPMKVEVEAQLANLEQAANPWWSTFCGITNGVWLGETAAFAPSTGDQPFFLQTICRPLSCRLPLTDSQRACQQSLNIAAVVHAQTCNFIAITDC